jgi:ACS family hexuronate transporter-like MFS transporter
MDTVCSIKSSAAIAPQRTRTRYYGILILLFAAGVINYVDRQTLSVLKPMVKGAFSIDDSGYALLVNIFTFCYAGAYIGTGWLVDKLGTRASLVLFIGLWSLATIGCGFASTFVMFAICRAVLGLAEPGNQPVTIRALTLWTPINRRGLTMSLVGAGGTVGSIAAAPLIAWLATQWGMGAAFVIPGIIGLLIGAVWWFVYRNPQATAHEGAHKKEAVPAIRWVRLWRERSLRGIVLARFISDPVWYFCLFWMPGYFQEQRGLSLEQAGQIGWIPFFAASLGGISMAALSDRMGRRMGDPMRARMRLLGFLALLGPVAMLVPRVPGLAATVFLLCVVAVVCLAWLSILGPLVADTFPAGNVASVWGIAGAFGAFGAILFNHQVGKITTALGAERMFLILGLLHLIAAGILFAFVRKVEAPGESPREAEKNLS